MVGMILCSMKINEIDIIFDNYSRLIVQIC